MIKRFISLYAVDGERSSNLAEKKGKKEPVGDTGSGKVHVNAE
jgi:hypothetical protein